jgi:hypothetical protein
MPGATMHSMTAAAKHDLGTEARVLASIALAISVVALVLAQGLPWVTVRDAPIRLGGGVSGVLAVLYATLVGLIVSVMLAIGTSGSMRVRCQLAGGGFAAAAVVMIPAAAESVIRTGGQVPDNIGITLGSGAGLAAVGVAIAGAALLLLQIARIRVEEPERMAGGSRDRTQML